MNELTVKDRILALIQAHPNLIYTSHSIQAALGCNRANAVKALGELAATGKIRRLDATIEVTPGRQSMQYMAERPHLLEHYWRRPTPKRRDDEARA